MTTIHPEGSIDLEVQDDVLLIGINRPNKRNGFTPKMYRELGEAYTRLDDDPSLRVGVLHALGDHFTADQFFLDGTLQLRGIGIALGLLLGDEGFVNALGNRLAVDGGEGLALVGCESRGGNDGAGDKQGG